MNSIPFGFRQIDYVIAVADLGSTAAAARLLNVSQPSVSVAVAQVEAFFGLPLFLRLPGQGMRLTPFGREQVARMRAVAREASSVFGQLRTPAHDLRLGVYSTLGPLYAPRLVRRFMDDHPGGKVTLVEDDIAGILRSIELGRLDQALLYDVGLPEGLHLTALADVPPHALLPVGHRLASAGPVDLLALSEDPVILIDLPHSRGYFLSLFHSAGARPRIAAETRSIEMLRGMVANGLGVGLLATVLPYDQTYDGRRVLRPTLRGAMPPSRIVLARSAAAHPTQAMTAMTTIAQQLIGGSTKRSKASK